MADVLFLTELLPYPLISGAKIRAYYVLRHLATSHQVTLLSFVRADDQPEDVAHLETFLTRVHTVPMRRSWLRNMRAALISLCTGRPAIIAREEIGAMRRKVEHTLEVAGFDVVHADQIPMAQYGLLGKAVGVKCLLDQHNATFQILNRLADRTQQVWKRLLLEREARAFARYESKVCHDFDHVTFVTQQDRQALMVQSQDRNLENQSTVIPICVDTESIEPVSPASAPFRVTHIGTMYWPPNIEGLLWFWDEVWPQVRTKVPQARLTVIGKNPSDRIRALGEQTDVDVLGYVKDLGPYLAETSVFIVPLHAAGGMRVKIIDAWCWGLPIVSTTLGAEGIALRDGENILLADTPDGFAQSVVQILRGRELGEHLRRDGRRWVEAHYNWKHVYGAWDDVYGRLLGA